MINSIKGGHTPLKAMLCLIFLLATPIPVLAEDTALKKAVEVSEAQTIAPLISRERFLERAVVGPAYLSPTGQYAVYLKRDKHRVSVLLSESESLNTKTLLITKSVEHIYWARTGYHIYLNVGDGVAVSNIKSDLFPRLVFKFGDHGKDRMLGVDPTSNAHFFISKYDPKTKQYFLLRVSLIGEEEVLFKSADIIRNILRPINGKKFFLTVIGQDAVAILAVDAGKSTNVLSCAYDEVCLPVSYDTESGALTIVANFQDDLSHLASLNLATGKVTVQHRDPESFSDLAEFQTAPLSGEVLSASYRYDYQENYGLTPYTAEHIDFIEEYFGQDVNVTIVPRKRGANWLVTAQYPNRREREHFFYKPDDKRIDPINVEYKSEKKSEPKLDEDILANVTPFSFEASDGVIIPAYLTLPRGMKISEAPLITLPHGGPWSRTDGTYNQFVQFLANRGYIVYQPNFRSSEGYGREFTNSIDGDFGDGRIQDDIIDGLKYLLENGIGNKERLGIFGHSFGGFSALNGITFTPDLFKVGIAGAPPANLGGTFLRITTKGKFLRNRPQAAQMFATRIGDINDKSRMTKLLHHSPLFNASKVRVPVLIMAGKEDDRVSSDEVLEYALKLEAIGKEVSLLMAEGEGHSYQSEEGRFAYFYLLEATLAKYLHGNVEPFTNDDKNFMKINRFIKRNTLIDKAGLLSHEGKN
jgi:dienelactone hydrolase